MLRFAAIAAFVCLPVLAQAPKTPTIPDGLATAISLEQQFFKISQEMYSAVVTVTGYERDPNAIVEAEAGPSDAAWVLSAFSDKYPGYRKVGIGSGVIVSEDGEILTCASILKKKDGTYADLVDVETDDQTNTICHLIAVEPTLNLALLKMEVFSRITPPHFKVAKFGNSAAMKPGSIALAIGDPFGPERHFSHGIVTSAPSRECYQEILTATYMQTTMLVHPQAYGGALVNLKGELIGILMPREPKNGTQPATPSHGIEFAMPANVVQGIYKALRMTKTFKSPWLGYSVMSRAEIRKERGPEGFNAMDKPRFGIMIENVFEGSPAAKAGIQPGDFLVKFDGEVIHTPIMFQRALYLAGIGADIKLEMYRAGKTIEVPLKVAERPAHATTR